MTFDKERKLEEDIFYMNAIDAAYYRKPEISVRLLSVVTILAFMALIAWAYFTKIDEVTQATGQVIPSLGIQVVTHLEGGILKELLVKEGDTVEKGSVLARISNEVSQAEYFAALEKSYALRASIIRYRAEIAGIEILEFDEELSTLAPELLKNEQKVFLASRTERNSKLAVLNSEYLLKQQELKTLQNKESSIKNSLRLNKQHLASLEKLDKENLAPKLDLLKQRETVISQEAELVTLFDGIKSLRIEISLAKNKYDLALAESQTEIANALNKAQTELSTLNQTILLGSSRTRRTEILSPVYGKIKRIFISTIGAVIPPATPIMEIVPLDDTLLIEVKILPADIGFIQKNQQALVKISAYDFSIFGGLEAYVEQISADTIEDNRGNVYYLALVRTHENTLEYRGKSLEIIPGMVTNVDILTGKKSVLDFILKPILKAKENAFTQR